MSTTITGNLMRSTDTRHTARPFISGYGGWVVTWIPERVLTRDQAITAMTIAEVVATHDMTDNQAPIWAHIDSWAAELGLSGPNAVSRASESPEDAADRYTTAQRAGTYNAPGQKVTHAMAGDSSLCGWIDRDETVSSDWSEVTCGDCHAARMAGNR